MFRDIYFKLCGPLWIKLLQWFKSRYNINLFNFVFEHNYPHSIQHTNTILKNTNLIIDQLIYVGSIGQIYRAFYKDKVVAVKVKHPINFKLVRVCKYLATNLQKIINVDDFLDRFEEQGNFETEAKNCQKFEEIFKNIESVIIPHVYEYTNDYIIMSYEEGKTYSECSKYILKNEIATLLMLSIKWSMYFHDILHIDLHIGNWKYRENPTQIVLYDFGFTSECNGKLVSDVIESFSCCEYDKTNKILLQHFTEHNLSEAEIDEILNNDDIKSIYRRPSDMMKIINSISAELRKYEIILKPEFFNCMFGQALVEKIFKNEGILANELEATTEEDENEEIKEIYVNSLKHYMTYSRIFKFPEKFNRYFLNCLKKYEDNK